jgi:Holliday junction resolvase
VEEQFVLSKYNHKQKEMSHFFIHRTKAGNLKIVDSEDQNEYKDLKTLVSGTKELEGFMAVGQAAIQKGMTF